MKSSWLVVIVCCAMLANSESSDGFGYELIVATLEAMEQKIDQLKTDHSEFNKKFASFEKDQFNQKLLITAKMDQLKKDQEKLNEDLLKAFTAEQSCPKEGNGTYHLKPFRSPQLIVYCEEGWIVIQRRINGSLSFNRTWNEYRNGFGDLQGEFWLGLENIHQLTREGSYDLRVILKSFDGVRIMAEYSGFNVSGEIKQYQLDVGPFKGGNAGDSLSYHKGMKFSTPDQDNDTYGENCAKFYNSGWWFMKCYLSNLNGVRANVKTGMDWNSFTHNRGSLSEARMMIRRSAMR